MKSTSDARVGNAEKLVTGLRSFTDYQPLVPENSIDKYSMLIAEVKVLNTETVTAKENNSLAIGNRNRLFEKDAYSVIRILSPINATVKAAFGKDSKEARDVAALIAKMRGNTSKVGKNPDEASVSRSYRSYHSTIQYLADLIAMLTSFGDRYITADPNLATTSLSGLYANSVAANNEVMNTFSAFQQSNSRRIEKYERLTESGGRIKDNVKGQYGPGSVEYRMIKSLVI